MAFQLNPRVYDEEGRWILPDWMPYPTDGSDDPLLRFAYGKLHLRTLAFDAEDVIERLRYGRFGDIQVKIGYVNLKPSAEEVSARRIFDEPRIRSVYCWIDYKSNVRWGRCQSPIVTECRDLHPRIGVAVEPEDAQIMEVRALTEDAVLNARLMTAVAACSMQADKAFRLVTGSSRFSTYLAAKTFPKALPGTRVMIDGVPVLEFRSAPGNRIVMSGLLPIGEAIWWRRLGIDNLETGLAQSGFLSPFELWSWERFAECLRGAYRRVEATDGDGKPYPMTESRRQFAGVRLLTNLFATEVEAAEMEETFEKNDNAGRVAERFLPSLRDPAFWEVVPLTMGDYDEFTLLVDEMPLDAARRIQGGNDWSERLEDPRKLLKKDLLEPYAKLFD
ncbi:MAG: hypothetical protein Q3Y13_04640 [Sutterella sp.]|nr:hypothetical protein [Sutterella sp.]